MRALMLAALVLLGCGGSSREAFAGDYIPVHIYVVQHPEALTPCEIDQALAYAKARYDRAGIRVEWVSMHEVTLDVNMQNQTYNSNRLLAARIWRDEHRLWDGWSAHYFFFPPMYCDGMRCFGGLAEGVCALRNGGLAMGQSGSWSSHNPPRPRIDASGMVAAHEIGHILGSRHYDAPDIGGTYEANLMDSAAGRFIDSYKPGLWFLPESIAEILACIGTEGSELRRALKQCKRKKLTKKARRRCATKARAMPYNPAMLPEQENDILFY